MIKEKMSNWERVQLYKSFECRAMSLAYELRSEALVNILLPNLDKTNTMFELSDKCFDKRSDILLEMQLFEYSTKSIKDILDIIDNGCKQALDIMDKHM